MEGLGSSRKPHTVGDRGMQLLVFGRGFPYQTLGIVYPISTGAPQKGRFHKGNDRNALPSSIKYILGNYCVLVTIHQFPPGF